MQWAKRLPGGKTNPGSYPFLSMGKCSTDLTILDDRRKKNSKYVYSKYINICMVFYTLQ